jgi:hypothetical protein
MTTKQRPHVTLDHPGELLASVPHLLGFHPSDSLVVLGLRGTTTASVRVVLRADLPPPEEIRALAEYLLLPLTQHNAESVVLVVVGGRAPIDDLPDRELLARCESVFVDAGFSVAHQLWTPDTAAGRRWRCYDDFNCTGVLPDPGGTDLARAANETGLDTYASRDEIVAMLAPEPDDVLARRSAAFDRRTDATEPEPTLSSDEIRTRLDAVRDAVESAVTTPPTLTDDDVVRLVGALSEHRIRDVNLDFDRLPDVAAAEWLWTALARATPAPERAEPACLLAFSAYARGDGVLAGIALANAEAADPGHRLSNLLRSALTLGLEPGKIRVAGIRAATFARQSLNEDLAQPEES